MQLMITMLTKKQFADIKKRRLSQRFLCYYLNFTAVPYAITSAAPCMTDDDA